MRQAGNDRAVAVHALLLHTAVLKTLEQGAARFAVMLAVTKAAGTDQVVELDETCLYVGTTDVPQAELPDARRVDQIAAARKWNRRAVVVVCVP